MDVFRVLDAAGGALLPLLSMKDGARALRCTCKAARAAVAAHPWGADGNTATVHGDVMRWCACFPQARAIIVRLYSGTACALYARRDAKEWLAHVPCLETLAVHGMGRFVPVRCLAGILRYVPRLRALELHGVDMDARDITALAHGLQCVPLLNALEFHGSTFARKPWPCPLWDAPLWDALRHVPLLTTLRVHKVLAPFDDLAAALRHVPRLTTLAVQWRAEDDTCYTAATAMIAVVEALVHTPRLEELTLGVDMNDALATALVQRLPHLARLSALGLLLDSVVHEDGRLPDIAPILASVPKVTSLTLYGEMTPPLLAPHPWLTHLYAQGWFVRYWSLAAWMLPKLETLSMRYCFLDTNDMRKLGKAMRHMPNLTELDLRSSSIGDGTERYLVKAFQYVPRLRILNLSNNHINNGYMAQFAPGLALLHQLAKLNICRTHIHEHDGVELAAALAAISTPTRPRVTVEVQQHMLSARGRRALAKVCHLAFVD